MSQFAVILPAAGQSRRFGDAGGKKIFADLNGRPVWLWAVLPFGRRADVTAIILAIAPEDRARFESAYAAEIKELGIQLVEGGAERHETVARSLEAVPGGCAYVAVHDAARPCVSDAVIDRVFQAAREHGAAVPGVPLSDTIKRVDQAGLTRETVPRTALYGVQTPQAFSRALLERAYAARGSLSQAITDDAQLVESLGHSCRVVEGSRLNLKITAPEDLVLARAFLNLLD